MYVRMSVQKHGMVDGIPDHSTRLQAINAVVRTRQAKAVVKIQRPAPTGPQDSKKAFQQVLGAGEEAGDGRGVLGRRKSGPLAPHAANRRKIKGMNMR